MEDCLQTHFQSDLRIISLTKENLINKQKFKNLNCKKRKDTSVLTEKTNKIAMTENRLQCQLQSTSISCQL